MVLKIIQYFSQCTNIFKKIDNTDDTSEWKSKGLSNEIIKFLSTSGNRLAPELSYIGYKTRVKFAGSSLKQGELTFTDIIFVYI